MCTWKCSVALSQAYFVRQNRINECLRNQSWNIKQKSTAGSKFEFSTLCIPVQLFWVSEYQLLFELYKFVLPNRRLSLKCSLLFYVTSIGSAALGIYSSLTSFSKWNRFRKLSTDICLNSQFACVCLPALTTLKIFSSIVLETIKRCTVVDLYIYKN